MDFLLTIILAFFIFLIGLIPFRVLYIISDFLRFVLHRVVGYRKKVVEENIRNSFPGLSVAEQKKLVNRSYKNLADIFVEGIKGFTISDKQVVARHKFINLEFLTPYTEAGKSVILLSAHYGNWEWGGLSIPLQLDNKHVIVLYKPLSNKFADRLVKKNRSRTGIFMGSIYETARLFKNYVVQTTAFFLLADQSPTNVSRSYWTNFMGRETAFLHGPERYARLYQLPVIFVDIQRVKRGYYEVGFSLITDNPASLPEGEITALYARKLEEVIRKKPENWLWSHRRWKLKKL
ncbi:MAG: acetyltransferase [bacterium]|nr:MAG: acetyltransferase [bacterium]